MSDSDTTMQMPQSRRGRKRQSIVISSDDEDEDTTLVNESDIMEVDGQSVPKSLPTQKNNGLGTKRSKAKSKAAGDKGTKRRKTDALETNNQNKSNTKNRNAPHDTCMRPLTSKANLCKLFELLGSPQATSSTMHEANRSDLEITDVDIPNDDFDQLLELIAEQNSDSGN